MSSMKTTFKTIQTERDAREKHRKLEDKTGLKLTCYSTGQGWHFRPYLHDGINPSIIHRDVLMKNLPMGMTGKSFTSIADETGLSLMEVMENVKALILDGIAIGDIGRDGKVVGAHLRMKQIFTTRPVFVAEYGGNGCPNCISMEHVTFKDDGECNCGIHRHHYHCNFCGKICQVG